MKKIRVFFDKEGNTITGKAKIEDLPVEVVVS